MPRGKWRESPQSLAEEAYLVLIERHKPSRRIPRSDLQKHLADPEVQMPFLQLCMEYDDTLSLVRFRTGLFLSVQAVGISEVSKRAKLHRVTLYRMLAKAGNPSLANLMRLLRVLDLRIWVLGEDFFTRRQRLIRPKDVIKEVIPSRGRKVGRRAGKLFGQEDDDE